MGEVLGKDEASQGFDGWAECSPACRGRRNTGTGRESKCVVFMRMAEKNHVMHISHLSPFLYLEAIYRILLWFLSSSMAHLESINQET